VGILQLLFSACTGGVRRVPCIAIASRSVLRREWSAAVCGERSIYGPGPRDRRVCNLPRLRRTSRTSRLSDPRARNVARQADPPGPRSGCRSQSCPRPPLHCSPTARDDVTVPRIGVSDQNHHLSLLQTGVRAVVHRALPISSSWVGSSCTFFIPARCLPHPPLLRCSIRAAWIPSNANPQRPRFSCRLLLEYSNQKTPRPCTQTECNPHSRSSRSSKGPP